MARKKRKGRKPKTQWTDHTHNLAGLRAAAQANDSASILSRYGVNESDADAGCRAMPSVSGERALATFNRDMRTNEFVIATETPVMVYDYEHGRINEILVTDGFEAPEGDYAPMLDSHNRWSIDDMAGSFSQFSKDNAAGQVIALAKYTRMPKGETAMTLVEEGHLRDSSVGWAAREVTYLKEGETKTIGSREYEGPVKLVTRWTVREVSVTPIGADPNAKARSASVAVSKTTEISESGGGRGQGNSTDKEYVMPKWLRERLVAAGLRAEASNDEAWEFARVRGISVLPEKESGQRAADAAAGSEGAAPVSDDSESGQQRSEVAPPAESGARVAPGMEDAEARMQRVLREDRERAAGVESLCLRHSVPDAVRSELVSSGASLDLAMRTVLDYISDNTTHPAMRGNVEVTAEERDKVRAVVADSIMVRAGLLSLGDAREGFNDFVGMSCRELARDLLRRRGESTEGVPLDLVGRALTTSDLPEVLDDAARRALAMGWETTEETWRNWCGRATAQDFRQHKDVRASELDDLEEVKEGGEFTLGYFQDKAELFQILTFGRLYPITRQALINDDLGAIVGAFNTAGGVSNRKLGDLAVAVLTANAAMNEDGIALFDGDHNNLLTDGAVNVAALAAIRLVLRTQKDVRNLRNLNTRLEHVVVPAALETAMEQLIGSEYDPAHNNAKVRNPFYNKVEVHTESRLDDAEVTTKYFGMGARGKAVKMGLLNGVEAPFIERKTGWSIDGVQLKVRLDAVAFASDWRGAVSQTSE